MVPIHEMEGHHQKGLHLYSLRKRRKKRDWSCCLRGGKGGRGGGGGMGGERTQCNIYWKKKVNLCSLNVYSLRINCSKKNCKVSKCLPIVEWINCGIFTERNTLKQPEQTSYKHMQKCG